MRAKLSICALLLFEALHVSFVNQSNKD